VICESTDRNERQPLEMRAPTARSVSRSQREHRTLRAAFIESAVMSEPSYRRAPSTLREAFVDESTVTMERQPLSRRAPKAWEHQSSNLRAPKSLNVSRAMLRAPNDESVSRCQRKHRVSIASKPNRPRAPIKESVSRVIRERRLLCASAIGWREHRDNRASADFYESTKDRERQPSQPRAPCSTSVSRQDREHQWK
jgi:hypothetical protein